MDYRIGYYHGLRGLTMVVNKLDGESLRQRLVGYFGNGSFAITRGKLAEVGVGYRPLQHFADCSIQFLIIHLTHLLSPYYDLQQKLCFLRHGIEQAPEPSPVPPAFWPRSGARAAGNSARSRDRAALPG